VCMCVCVHACICLCVCVCVHARQLAGCLLAVVLCLFSGLMSVCVGG